MPNQPAEQAEHDDVLRLVGAGRLLRHLGDRAPRTPRAGVTPASGSSSGATPVLRVVDDDGVAADRQLGAELQEVVPVERDRHVERAAGVEARARSRGARRHDDSPPRICEPKLLVMHARGSPRPRPRRSSDSPAETMPSPPDPAMPTINPLPTLVSSRATETIEQAPCHAGVRGFALFRGFSRDGRGARAQRMRGRRGARKNSGRATAPSASGACPRKRPAGRPPSSAGR